MRRTLNRTAFRPRWWAIPLCGLVAIGCLRLVLFHSAPLFSIIREYPLLTLDGDQALTSWSPDGSQFAFRSNVAGNWDVWTARRDGTALRQLTHEPSWDDAASWSPDGRELVFSSDRVNRVWPDLWLMDPAQPSSVRRLTKGNGKYFFPTWSPDGQQIAFLFLPTGPAEFELRCLTVRDGSIRTLFTDKVVFSQLAWSPDGRRLAFSSERTGNPELWAIDTVAETPTVQQLTHHPAADFNPSWSPDGRFLAFTSTRSGNRDLWVLKLPLADAPVIEDATTLQQLTHDPAADDFPHWSPDGRSLAFTSDRLGNQDPWLMTVRPAAGP